MNSIVVLPLNVCDQRVRRDLVDVQAAHRTVQSLVVGRRADEGLLWGVWTDVAALVLSHPSGVATGSLPSGYLRGAPELLAQPEFVTGDRVLLRGMVNPVVQVTDARGRRKAGVASVDGREEWISRKLAGVANLVGYREVSQVRLSGRRAGQLVTIDAVDVRADVLVSDPEGLSRLLGGGVGRGRAYGCGLLIPVR